MIWCADAALPTMLSHQVIPDLVASVDAGKDLACFADERSNQIPVLGSSNTRTEFLKRNTAKKIWGFDHEQILMMQKRAGIEISQVPYYLGVSTAMLSSAIEFGAKKYYFCRSGFSVCIRRFISYKWEKGILCRCKRN